LATCDDPEQRDAIKAVTFAKKACELTGHKQIEFLDTLSVAFAADGNFTQAVETAQKAVGLAIAAGNNTKAEQLKERIELYNFTEGIFGSKELLGSYFMGYFGKVECFFHHGKRHYVILEWVIGRHERFNIDPVCRNLFQVIDQCLATPCQLIRFGNYFLGH